MESVRAGISHSVVCQPGDVSSSGGFEGHMLNVLCIWSRILLYFILLLNPQQVLNHIREENVHLECLQDVAWLYHVSAVVSVSTGSFSVFSFFCQLSLVFGLSLSITHLICMLTILRINLPLK